MLHCRKGNVVVSNHKFCFSLLLLGCGAAEEGGGRRKEGKPLKFVVNLEIVMKKKKKKKYWIHGDMVIHLF